MWNLCDASTADKHYLFNKIYEGIFQYLQLSRILYRSNCKNCISTLLHEVLCVFLVDNILLSPYFKKLPATRWLSNLILFDKKNKVLLCTGKRKTKFTVKYQLLFVFWLWSQIEIIGVRRFGKKSVLKTI